MPGRRHVLSYGVSLLFAQGVPFCRAKADEGLSSDIRAESVVLHQCNTDALIGYAARPAQGTAFPVIILGLVPPWFDKLAVERDCHRLARMGFLAVAPYPREAMRPAARTMRIVDVAAAWAVAHGRGDPARLMHCGWPNVTQLTSLS